MSIDYQELTGKLIIENSELKDQLSHTTQELEGIYHMVETTPNNMDLGKMVRSYYWENTEEFPNESIQEPVYIYESPDEGKTLYRREIGSTQREKVSKTPEQMSLFGEGDIE